MQAFHELSPSRQSGFGIGHIPLVEVLAWCDLYDVTDRETACRRIRAADRAFVGFHAEQTERQRKGK